MIKISRYLKQSDNSVPKQDLDDLKKDIKLLDTTKLLSDDKTVDFLLGKESDLTFKGKRLLRDIEEILELHPQLFAMIPKKHKELIREYLNQNNRPTYQKVKNIK